MNTLTAILIIVGIGALGTLFMWTVCAVYVMKSIKNDNQEPERKDDKL